MIGQPTLRDAVSNLDSKQKIAVLIELKIRQLKEPYRFQNWCHGEYFWCGQPYQFIDFVGSPGSVRQSDFSNTGVPLTIANRSARHDGLRPVRELLKRYDGLARAKVRIYEIWPEDLTAMPISDRLQVLSDTISGAEVELDLKAPIEAVNCVVPTVFLTHRIAPGLPQASAGRF